MDDAKQLNMLRTDGILLNAKVLGQHLRTRSSMPEEKERLEYAEATLDFQVNLDRDKVWSWDVAISHVSFANQANGEAQIPFKETVADTRDSLLPPCHRWTWLYSSGCQWRPLIPRSISSNNLDQIIWRYICYAKPIPAGRKEINSPADMKQLF